MNKQAIIIFFFVITVICSPETKLFGQQLIATGDSLLKAKAYEKALTVFQEAQQNPDLKQIAEARIQTVRKQLQSANINYQKALQEGLKYMQAKNYPQAKAAFTNALRHKPNERYPKLKLEEIREKYQDPAEEKAYAEAITKAEKALEQLDYPTALEAYEAALNIKPKDVVALKSIKNIRKFLSKQEQMQLDFERYMNAGATYYQNKFYEQALNQFQQALLVNPTSQEAQKKVRDIREILAKQQKQLEAYNQQIALADSFYIAKAYTKAKAAYQQARQINPEARYPLNMIEKIDPSLAQQAKKETAYQQTIATADTALKENNRNKALKNYQEALSMKPDATYPASQIQKINQILKTEQQAYQDMLAKADSLFDNQALTEAKTEYEKALKLKPEEAYPKEQLAQIRQRLFAAQKELMMYDSLIAVADRFYESKSWQQALAVYQEASELMPSKSYPGQQSKAIKQILADQEAAEQQYALLVNKADSLFQRKDLNAARKQYVLAQQVFDRDYINRQINLIDQQLGALKQKQQEYENVIASADNKFNANQLTEAKALYSQASKILTDNPYPGQQIAAIDSITAARTALKQQYQMLISQADRYFQEKDYNKSLAFYQDARELLPNEPYPENQIALINQKLTALENKGIAYKKQLFKADSLFDSKAYALAIAAYQDALAIFSDKTYPAAQIDKCKAVLKDLEEQQKMYENTIAVADSFFAAARYEEAIDSYTHALEFRKSDAYAASQIAKARSAIQNINNTYNQAMASGNQFFNSEKYNEALRQFQLAAKTKPDQSEPDERIKETMVILEKQRQAMMAKYQEVIREAEIFHEAKNYSDAIETYEKAARINPEESYPKDQIAAIKKYLAEHSLREIMTGTLRIQNGQEEKFDFSPLSYTDRKNNYIVIKIKPEQSKRIQLFLNYGSGNQKNGGVVIPLKATSETRQYIVNLTEHRRWYDNENNWITLYAQGGDIQISGLEVVKSD